MGDILRFYSPAQESQTAMSLRKRPALTPRLLAADARNAQKSTGPRTRRGKLFSSSNGWKGGRPAKSSYSRRMGSQTRAMRTFAGGCCPKCARTILKRTPPGCGVRQSTAAPLGERSGRGEADSGRGATKKFQIKRSGCRKHGSKKEFFTEQTYRSH